MGRLNADFQAERMAPFLFSPLPFPALHFILFFLEISKRMAEVYCGIVTRIVLERLINGDLSGLKGKRISFHPFIVSWFLQYIEWPTSFNYYENRGLKKKKE